MSDSVRELDMPETMHIVKIHPVLPREKKSRPGALSFIPTAPSRVSAWRLQVAKGIHRIVRVDPSRACRR